MKILSTLETEILIVGGGPSGIMAAKAAAKEGKDVMLIERYGFLGGCATMSLVVPLMTFHAGEKQIVKGYAQELIDRISELGGTIGHINDAIGFGSSVTPVDTEIYKYVAQEFLLEDNVKILFHTELFDVEMDGDHISSVIVKTRSGFYRIVAKRYVDATGDGDLTYLSGNPMAVGRESDGKCQPMTMMFKVGNVDIDKIIQYADEHPEEMMIDTKLNSLGEAERIAVSGYFSVVEEALKNGDLTFNRDRVLFFELNRRGEIAVNMSRVIDKVAINGFELSEATIEGRRQVFEIMNFFKKYIAGFENAILIESGSQMGVRESRRLIGEYTITEHDIVAGRKFEDGIAQCAWPIDIHDPDGKELIVTQMEKGTYYEIPYGCLIPKKSNNLIVTGRTISATHEAFASTRVSPTCMALGQAAGMAAAISLEEDVAFRDVSVAKLCTRLKDTGQVID
ncbi:MAG: FAD-dependent oxidoreductase [Epulopiscium sp.]|nr:FAD-dependent oxidoreductase [Candidatus Epulonipiscium sp.]